MAKVKPNDDVTVYGTGTGKYLAAGQARTVHKILAEQLIAKGAASYEKLGEKKATKTKEGV